MSPSTEYTQPELSTIRAKIEQYKLSRDYMVTKYLYKSRINKSGG